MMMMMISGCLGGTLKESLSPSPGFDSLVCGVSHPEIYSNKKKKTKK